VGAAPKEPDGKERTNGRKRRTLHRQIFRRGVVSPFEQEPKRKRAGSDSRRLNEETCGAHIARPNLFSSIESPARALLDTLHETASELLQLSRRAAACVKNFPAPAGAIALGSEVIRGWEGFVLSQASESIRPLNDAEASRPCAINHPTDENLSAGTPNGARTGRQYLRAGSIETDEQPLEQFIGYLPL
jgi:hypothetical protein